MERFGWWVDMLLMASYEDNKSFVGNQVMEVKRGVLVASLRFLADRWKVSKDRVNAFLKLLSQEGMISRETNKNTTLITICNYESYQDNSDDSQTPSRHLQDTTSTPSRQTKEIQEIQEINNNNSNAHTREDLPTWEEVRERGFKEAFKQSGQIMALARNCRLNAQEICNYLERYMNERQIIDLGHQDSRHFAKGFKKYVEDEMKKPKPTETPKVIEGAAIYNLDK